MAIARDDAEGSRGSPDASYANRLPIRRHVIFSDRKIDCAYLPPDRKHRRSSADGNGSRCLHDADPTCREEILFRTKNDEHRRDAGYFRLLFRLALPMIAVMLRARSMLHSPRVSCRGCSLRRSHSFQRVADDRWLLTPAMFYARARAAARFFALILRCRSGCRWLPAATSKTHAHADGAFPFCLIVCRCLRAAAAFHHRLMQRQHDDGVDAALLNAHAFFLRLFRFAASVKMIGHFAPPGDTRRLCRMPVFQRRQR